MKRVFTLVMFGVVSLSMLTQVHAATRIEFILDASGSMEAQARGEQKIISAKKAIAQAISGIPENTVVALRIYGHRISKGEKAKSCKDSELVIPFGPINPQRFLQALDRAVPLGQTPIAYSLQEAVKDFGEAKDENTAIILVSDGEETCGGDPVAVARDLIAQGFQITIHTIGFDVDPTTRAQLEAISRATGGQYRDARDAQGLADSLKELTQESLIIEKEKSVYGEPIRGGDAYETAVEIKPGELYHLDHHQKKGYFDYFAVDVKPGQLLTASIQTGEKGVSIQDQTAKENTNPYAGIQIHNGEHKRVTYDTIIGSRNEKKDIWVNVGAGQEGRYYILVGNTYDDQNKDQPFRITLEDRFDAGSQRDAGEKEESALSIAPGSITGYLGPGDTIDLYRITAAPSQRFRLKARPGNDKVTLRMEVLDSDGIRLFMQHAPNPGAAVRIPECIMPKDGQVFVKISSYYGDLPLTDYELTIEPQGDPQAVGAETEEAAPPPPPPQAQSPASRSETVLAVPQAAPAEEIATSAGPALSLWGKLRTILLMSGIPLAAGLLIGFLWGYLKGRKAHKQKAQGS